MQDKAIYLQSFEELNAGTIDPALWAMVWTQAEGDENKAGDDYIAARVREIGTQLRCARRAARGPLSEKVPWRLLGLSACAAAFAIINSHLVATHTYNAPVLRWDFWLVSMAASTLGPMRIPGFALLVTRGSRRGYRVGFLMLGIGGCLAGCGGLPPDYVSDTQGAVNGYFWTGFGILICGLLYAVLVREYGRGPAKSPQMRMDGRS